MNNMLEPGGPLPASLGRCVDLYHDVRNLRLMMEKEAARIAQREAEVKEHLIRNISASDGRGVVGMRYKAMRVEKEKYRIGREEPSDISPGVMAGGWGAFTSWVRRHDYFHFLQKRISETAVKEFVEAEGRIPPGLEAFNFIDLSVTKV